MDRATTILSIAGHEFTTKTYATALEQHTIQQAYLKGAKVEVVGNQPKISEFNPAVEFDVKQEMIRQMVVSMDGSDENIVERCLELPAGEFDELATAIDELIAAKKKP